MRRAGRAARRPRPARNAASRAASARSRKRGATRRAMITTRTSTLQTKDDEVEPVAGARVRDRLLALLRRQRERRGSGSGGNRRCRFRRRRGGGGLSRERRGEEAGEGREAEQACFHAREPSRLPEWRVRGRDGRRSVRCRHARRWADRPDAAALVASGPFGRILRLRRGPFDPSARCGRRALRLETAQLRDVATHLEGRDRAPVVVPERHDDRLADAFGAVLAAKRKLAGPAAFAADHRRASRPSARRRLPPAGIGGTRPSISSRAYPKIRSAPGLQSITLPVRSMTMTPSKRCSKVRVWRRRISSMRRTVRDVPEAPDAAHRLPRNAVRRRVSLEDAPVLELEPVVALGLGLAVQLPNLLQEAVRILQLVEDVGEHLAVVARQQRSGSGCATSRRSGGSS